jgi:hypothetical protein
VKRTLLGVLLAFAFIGAGWSAGKAQTRVADFEIAIDAPRGQMKVTCSRGCDWVRESGSSVPTATMRCETERCRWMFNGHGPITLGMPLERREQLIIKR